MTPIDRHEPDVTGARFRRALLEQRAMRLKGGLYHLNQIRMAYNSNRIEGSQLSEDQTRSIFETSTVTGDANVNDVIETANHFRAFDSILANVGQLITAEHIKDIHRLLKSGTSDANKDWFAVGDWKKLPNSVGRIETTPPGEVGGAISELLAITPTSMTFEDICDFHAAFETIHPFQDGNGRVGRLLMFQQCLDNDIVPFIVRDDQKAFYYRGLDQYPEERGFLYETCAHFQDQYLDEFAHYLPAAPLGRSLHRNDSITEQPTPTIDGPAL